MCLFCTLQIYISMHPLLKINTVSLSPDNASCQSIDMLGQCAFAICTKGEFVIKILNEQYDVRCQGMFACMPFVHIDVVAVGKPSEVIFGCIQIEDVPNMINRWINTNNLIAIQNSPLVRIPDERFCRLIFSINEYQSAYEEVSSGSKESICNHLQQDILDYQCRLIVAQVLKIYFANMPMEVSGHTHRDLVFQQFMLSLYSKFREHRSVEYYASMSGVSLKYFSTIVRQLSCACPSEWIETVVVGEAKSLLSDVQRSIKDIAALLNFPDAPTFTKYFLRVTGMTPKSYRKAIQ